jgi:hypothetical protein
MAGFCEYGNEFSGSIKGGEFLDCLSNYPFFKKHPAPWTPCSNNNEMSISLIRWAAVAQAV